MADSSPEPEMSRPPGWEDFVPELKVSRPPGFEHLIPQSPPPPISGSLKLVKSTDCSSGTSPPLDREKSSALSTPNPGVLSEEKYTIAGSDNLEKIMGGFPQIGGSPCQDNMNSELTPLSENNITSSSPINKMHMAGSPVTSAPPVLGDVGSQPTSPPLPGSVNLEKRTGFPANSSPLGWDDIQHQSTSPGSVNVEKNVGGSPETVEVRPQPTPSPGLANPEKNVGGTLQPTLPGSVNMEKAMVSSLEISPPPGWENVPSQPIHPPEPLQGSANIEKSVASSPDPSLPPGWENASVQPVLPYPSTPGSENLEKNADGCSGTVEPSVQPTLPGSPNIEKSMVSSPENSLPPCWENVCSQPIPPAPLPGSVNMENSLVSSLQISLPPGWENASSQPVPPLPSLPSSANVENSLVNSPNISLPPGWENASSQAVPPLPSLPEMSQLVCGTCRQLLLYPRGTMHVQCPCCQIINFALEEHEVGNVKCGNCFVLLMYPYGAPAVRCSACCFVTEIGPHNVRPRLSVQQGRAPPPPQNLVR